MKTLIASITMVMGLTAISEGAFAQRYRDYDDPPPRYRGERPYRDYDESPQRYRGERSHRGYGGCLSSDGINARLRSQGYRQLALRDQGPNVLVMSTIYRGRPYLIFVNGCTGNVFDTRSQ